MKKYSIFIITFLVASLMFAACQPAAPAPAEPEKPAAPAEATKAPEPAEPAAPEAKPAGGLPDLEGREVTIAIENAYPPFNYVDAKTGEAGGWDYETWNEICKRVNCKPVFTEAAWEGMIQAVADKQFDAAADGITNTPERAKVVDFSIGYIKTEQRLLVRKGEARFKSIEDIVKDPALRLGTQTGTTNYETAIKYLPEDRIKAFEQFPFAVQALIADDIDAVIIDAYAGVGYTGENKENVELIGPSISSDELGFIFSKGSDLVAPVNAAIQSMIDDGTLNELNKKFFGPDFVAPSAEEAAPPEGAALPDLEGREVTIAIENAYPPFNYVDAKTGEAGGWDYETWNEICKRVNCKPVYTEAAWEGMIQAVSDKQFDAAADGITNTPERAKVVDFSIGYIKTEQRLLVRKGEARFKSIEDIVKDPALRLGTQTGTTNYETAIKYLPEDRIKAFEQFPFAVQALIADDIDAVIIDAYAGVGYTGENKENVELIGPSISSDELGFIFSKGSDLVAPVNAAIQSMIDDGTLNELNKKFFGPDFVAPAGE